MQKQLQGKTLRALTNSSTLKMAKLKLTLKLRSLTTTLGNLMRISIFNFMTFLARNYLAETQGLL